MDVPLFQIIITSLITAAVSSILTAIATIFAIKTEVAVVKALFEAHTADDERRFAELSTSLHILMAEKRGTK